MKQLAAGLAWVSCGGARRRRSSARGVSSRQVARREVCRVLDRLLHGSDARREPGRTPACLPQHALPAPPPPPPRRTWRGGRRTACACRSWRRPTSVGREGGQAGRSCAVCFLSWLHAGLDPQRRVGPAGTAVPNGPRCTSFQPAPCSLLTCPPARPPALPLAVCTTLSFSGSSAFTRLTRKFDVVVIDEAAQVRGAGARPPPPHPACTPQPPRTLGTPLRRVVLQGLPVDGSRPAPLRLILPHRPWSRPRWCRWPTAAPSKCTLSGTPCSCPPP